ncbi:hypothetical protein J4E85_001813 [Alternaria conjuncta]|uniref:uncharacterized protein n=1 Tax=Alternaria conjuncta TaxID=181017 RepID=UPI00221F4CDA|nr:uncharacterized protein J4E85_001813 [Alternaria conjuncta]KAI4936483.1 hypothetical protein J4E85_001813 [Alternaria conjuncta]
MAGGNSEQKVLLDVFLQKIRQKDEEIEGMRKQKRDDDAALRIAHERIAQLEKQIKKQIAIKAQPWRRGEHNNDEPSRSFASKVKSTADASTGKALNGKQPVMPTTKASLSSEKCQIPGKKRRKHWYDSWYKVETKIVYSNDEVLEMELPCFDSKFDHIGIARPAENPDDRHTECRYCLQFYIKEDLWDHVDVCRAFWNLAVRCGHCGRIFKLNDAFYGLHAPECKVKSQDTEFSGYHYTLARAGV